MLFKMIFEMVKGFRWVGEGRREAKWKGLRRGDGREKRKIGCERKQDQNA
jgi:hypothetical protein